MSDQTATQTASTSGLSHRPIAGILAMLAAIGLFSTMDLFIKLAAEQVGIIEILMFRMAFGMVPLIPMMFVEAGSANILPLLKTRYLGLHALRSMIGMVFLAMFFTSVALLPLADAYAIGFAAPLWVAALSVPMLGERVGWRRWLAIVVGLIGVIIILRPGGGVLSLGGLIGLAATVLFAISMIMMRSMARTESSSAIVFYFQAYAALVTALMLIAAELSPAFGALWGGYFAWTTPTSWGLWAQLIGIGLIGGVGQACITLALRFAPAVVVSPFTYSSILWGLAYGIWLFGDVPTVLTLVGAGIVIASGLYILFREAAASRVSIPSGN